MSEKLVKCDRCWNMVEKKDIIRVKNLHAVLNFCPACAADTGNLKGGA